MNWKDAIEQWRALPEREQFAIEWRLIPRQVADSMAFEGEPVDRAWLEELHRRMTPPDLSKQLAGF